MFEEIDPSFLLYSPFDIHVIPDDDEEDLRKCKRIRARKGRKGLPDRGSRDPDSDSDPDPLFDEWVNDSLESFHGTRSSSDHSNRVPGNVSKRNDSWESMEEAFWPFLSTSLPVDSSIRRRREN